MEDGQNEYIYADSQSYTRQHNNHIDRKVDRASVD